MWTPSQTRSRAPACALRGALAAASAKPAWMPRSPTCRAAACEQGPCRPLQAANVMCLRCRALTPEGYAPRWLYERFLHNVHSYDNKPLRSDIYMRQAIAVAFEVRVA